MHGQRNLRHSNRLVFLQVLGLKISELATGVLAMSQGMAAYGEPYAKCSSLLAACLRVLR